MIRSQGELLFRRKDAVETQFVSPRIPSLGLSARPRREPSSPIPVILKIKWRRVLSDKWRSLSGLRGHGRVESAFASVNCQGAGGARPHAARYRRTPPMTLGNAAAARVRLIVWCLDCHHQVEPDPADGRALRRQDDRPGLAQAARLRPVRQPAGRHGRHRDRSRWRIT
jgi:hypothetical protein